MTAERELINYMEHYGHEGLNAILAYLEEQGYTITEPEDDDE